MPETDLPELELLAPTWVDELRRQGVSTSAELALWRDDHTVPPALERVEMMRRWARGEARIVDLGRELGVAHSRVQHLLTDTVLQLIAPHLEDIPRWHRARAAGLGSGSVASLSATYPEVVDLALDGWPQRRRQAASDAQVAEAHRRWLAGAARDNVAEALGLSEQKLTAQLRTGETVLVPRRLTSADLRDRFGWTPSAASLYRRKGVLPPPDGRDGLRQWWWQMTIDDWEDGQVLHWCRTCRHAFIAHVGLKEHTTRVHRGQGR